MITVLVLLAAISLLTIASVERSTMSLLLGRVAERHHVQRSALKSAILARAHSGLVPGPDGVCTSGVCGRSVSGAQRDWTASEVVLHGVPAAETSMCSPLVVTEYLGSSDGRDFWKLASTCRSGDTGTGLLVAEGHVVGGGVAQLEWVVE